MEFLLQKLHGTAGLGSRAAASTKLNQELRESLADIRKHRRQWQHVKNFLDLIDAQDEIPGATGLLQCSVLLLDPPPDCHVKLDPLAVFIVFGLLQITLWWKLAEQRGTILKRDGDRSLCLAWMVLRGSVDW